MLDPERLSGLINGKPGAIVNEDFSEERGWFLYYAYYDKNERLVGYAEFPRNTSPEEISKVLNQNADFLMDNYMGVMTWEEATQDANELRLLARNVPGLRKQT